jgi:outer membrane biogenesis lipoprotein LolB
MTLENHVRKVLLIPVLLILAGCTVKAVGDPNRPITINAHITVDIKGLQQTASGIEDFVSGKTSDIKK